MTEIYSFDTLLQAAREQPEPQRLLFLFLKAGLPDDHDEAQAARFREGQGGALLPIMYVDKLLRELSTFEALVEESRQMGEDWHIMLVAAMPGRDGVPPSEGQADDALKVMVKTVHAGGDLSQYLAFDTRGKPVRFL
ncbi:ribonucleotide reductase subunit alpha [Arhodomonas sp. AD133]|uniref:ribonucleotide reductase subunit alpha n=1 Tax=Arhodomonas sp. AD133 TaxID=3415009 RepID=UPI003EB78DB7